MPEKNNQPATIPDITIAVGVLFRQLRAPRGVKTDEDRIDGYIIALNGFPLEAIETAVAQVLRREVPSIKNPDYCPSPPVLAEIVRTIAPDARPPRTGQAPAATKRLYAYKPPGSKIIERRCTKDFARQLVEQGIHPRGSIWCPGPINENPEWGDLYGPDPDWQHPVSWPPAEKTEDEAGSHRPPPYAARKMRDWTEPKREEPPPPPPPRREVPDYSKDTIQVTEALLKALETKPREERP